MSKRKYFGTDGIRGTANSWPMDAETALRVGLAAGKVFTRGEHRHRVVVGKDTRLSGYMIEPALQAGFTAVGMDVFLLGPLPTPAVAMLTRSLRADLGVMISASHNAYYDNGIKLFGPDGYKLSDKREAEIEKLMEGGLDEGLAESERLGRAKRIDDAGARYIEFAKATFPKHLRLDGLRIVVDCAHGAGYRVAPAVLWELGAEVIPMGVEPNGFNINKDCGSTHTRPLSERVREYRADIGIALDGDADRVLICDERGKFVDGDQLLALVAKSWRQENRLSSDAVVATVMSNLGLEHYLEKLGLKLLRTQVGDRYVVEQMRARKVNVGGEQSGHIILSDFTTTGDGLIAALQVLAVLVASRKPVSEVCHLFEPLPQVLENVRYANGMPLDCPDVSGAIEAAKASLGKRGRIVVRKSGTERLIRVMGEGEDAREVKSVVRSIVDAIKAASA